MKYTIHINQLYFAKQGMDLKDCAILDYIKSWCSVDDKKVKQLTLEDDGVSYRYTWINFNHLIKEMPLLGIKNKASISERVSKIVKRGFIKTFQAPDGSLYIRLLPKIKEIEFGGTVRRYEQGVSQDEQEPFGNTNSTIKESIKDNISNNKEISTDISGKDVNDLIELFRPVNPTVDRLFSRPPQRESIKRLVKQFGVARVEKTIKILPIANADRYSGISITTPTQLENGIGKLKAFFMKQASKGPKGVSI